ncbi:MAG: hypothetical protein WC455_17790 [Dehalococcoidia bacterium]|jgi:hypothetical protein
MTEQKNPFEAAIEQLRFGIPKSMGYSTDEVASFRAATKLLEAAWRVDKKAGLLLLNDCYASCSFQRYGNVRESDLYRQIQAILEALPDPAKGKEEK